MYGKLQNKRLAIVIYPSLLSCILHWVWIAIRGAYEYLPVTGPFQGNANWLSNPPATRQEDFEIRPHRSFRFKAKATRCQKAANPLEARSLCPMSGTRILHRSHIRETQYSAHNTVASILFPDILPETLSLSLARAYAYTRVSSNCIVLTFYLVLMLYQGLKHQIQSCTLCGDLYVYSMTIFRLIPFFTFCYQSLHSTLTPLILCTYESPYSVHD